MAHGISNAVLIANSVHLHFMSTKNIDEYWQNFKPQPNILCVSPGPDILFVSSILINVILAALD